MTTALFKVHNQVISYVECTSTLLGADNFYDEIFSALRIPYEPIRWANDFAFTT
jgi:hypothetical protein